MHLWGIEFQSALYAGGHTGHDDPGVPLETLGAPVDHWLDGVGVHVTIIIIADHA